MSKLTMVEQASCLFKTGFFADVYCPVGHRMVRCPYENLSTISELTRNLNLRIDGLGDTGLLSCKIYSYRLKLLGYERLGRSIQSIYR
jgi:hypothetical protein